MEGLQYTPPEVAVANAIGTAQKYFQSQALKYPDYASRGLVRPTPDTEQWLIWATYRRSAIGSALVIADLMRYQSTDFTNYMLLRAQSRIPPQGCSNGGFVDFTDDPIGMDQVSFLTRATDGTFLAGRPAYYNPAHPERMVQQITSKRLDAVLANLHEQYGGIWPEAESIEQSLAAYEHPAYIINPDSGEVSIACHTVRSSYDTEFPSFRDTYTIDRSNMEPYFQTCSDIMIAA